MAPGIFKLKEAMSLKYNRPGICISKQIQCMVKLARQAGMSPGWLPTIPKKAYTKEIPMLNLFVLYMRLNQVKQSIGSCEQKKYVKGP